MRTTGLAQLARKSCRDSGRGEFLHSYALMTMLAPWGPRMVPHARTSGSSTGADRQALDQPQHKWNEFSTTIHEHSRHHAPERRLNEPTCLRPQRRNVESRVKAMRAGRDLCSRLGVSMDTVCGVTERLVDWALHLLSDCRAAPRGRRGHRQMSHLWPAEAQVRCRAATTRRRRPDCSA